MSSAELLASAAPQFRGGPSIRDKEAITATSFSAPNTAPPSASLVLDGTQAQPTFTVSMTQANPELAASGDALQCYATRPGNPANSFVIARPSVAAMPLSTPTTAMASVLPGFAAHTQVGAADTILCPSLTGNCKIMTWLAGGSQAAFAAGIAPATIQNFNAGTSFQISGTPGAIYGYMILYA